MLDWRKRIAFIIFSFSSKLEPQPDLSTGSGQNVPAPQHWCTVYTNSSVHWRGTYSMFTSKTIRLWLWARYFLLLSNFFFINIFFVWNIIFSLSFFASGGRFPSLPRYFSVYTMNLPVLRAGFRSRSRPEPGYLAGAGAVTLSFLK